MINVLIKTLQIDTTYSVNSFIYSLRKLPILSDLFTYDIYKSKIIKKIIGFFGLIFSLSRAIIFKYFYFFIIYFVSYKLLLSKDINTYIHIYFFLTVLGMFINNNLLNASKKKYFSLVLFNIDASKYLKTIIIWNSFKNFIYNTLFLYYFLSKYESSSVIIYTLLMSLVSLLLRIIGESLNIIFYKKYNYIWYSNTKLYFPIVLLLFGCSLLPCLNFSISFNIIIIVTIILIPFSLISFIYLFKLKDYKIMYKRIFSLSDIMNSKNEEAYLRQSMLEVKEKDKVVDNKLIENKSGYDLFNTIFFQRHREILLRSAKKYSLVLIGIYIFLVYVMLKYSNYNNSIAELIHYKLSIFVMIMFIINRGSIITQAMFFNCDHAMLRYNFYREPKVILELFKKRLITVVKVNLLPALVIGIGNIILLTISKNEYSILTMLTTFTFILSLSIFFSVHYLVIYYLLQPYNQNMELKKASYTIVTLITYVLTYILTDLVLTSELLSIFGILFVVIYVIISLLLVYKIAPRTFKL